MVDQKEYIVTRWSLIVLSGLAIFFDLCSAFVAFTIGDTRADHCLNLMFVLFGMGLSIPVGFLLTPGNPQETFEFSNIGKAVLTFGSGFLLSKFSSLVEVAVLSPKIFAPMR